DKRQLALDVGAHHALPSDESAVEEIRRISRGRGATAIFDFVGIGATTALAAKLPHFESDIVVVGVGDGTVPVGIFSLPYATSVRATYWGSIPELHEVLELARVGAINVETERFSLDEAPKAYQRLSEGSLRGRAVVVP
ncbi:MAG: zinc-binding dehydrogenase, partial [Rhodococcus sp.]|nr:zinc-binding dehydrogenase [Rhodococcus sp. (in: high G+C Gram-positive bacteria)]